MEQSPDMKNKRSSTVRWLNWAVVAAFLIAAAVTAYLTFVVVRDIVTSWELTSLPGISIKPADADVAPEAPGVITDAQTPLQVVGVPTPEPWDGASRVSLLVMGLDYRDWAAGEGAPRTDTMILLTIDPLTRTAGILSVPRDLWVNIPGFEYGRINTAYSLGEAFEYPSGGPGLAMVTVEELLGVPIDYYAQVDFGAFVRFIDEIGGVKLDIQERITIDPLGDNNTKTLKPGVQTLPGELALAYARARKTEGGDFDRAQRQQQVILAIRQQMLRPKLLPTLIAKAPVLYQEISSGVQTNMNLDQVIQLAWLASQIEEENIKRGVIGPPDQVLLVKSPQGDDVLKPIADKIRLLRDQVFFGSEPISPAAVGMSPVDLVVAEAPKISVLNGTSTPGLAALTTDYLQSLGISITDTGNADQLYPYTTIFDYTGKIYTVKYLMELMSVPGNRYFSRYDPANPVDLVVILGADWAGSNPMP
ncbi:MAG: LCP family protein [Anaerolineales bacterium]|nr:MAG: LCP family protein [Anaerolineales bacterium]